MTRVNTWNARCVEARTGAEGAAREKTASPDVTPLPPHFFVSADSKGVTLRNRVSVDSGSLKVLCFECAVQDLVSADSKGVKVVCFDTDSRASGSVDSRRVSRHPFVSADSKELSGKWAGNSG